MKIINAKTDSVVLIGYAGENNTRQVIFSYPAEWLEEYPVGTMEIHIKRAGDGVIYKAENVEQDRVAGTLTWIVTNADTSYSGNGQAQLCCVDNGKVVKTQIYSTSVSPSVSTNTPVEPPPQSIVQEAVENYLEQYVNVITVDGHGEEGQILQSDGDGSYSWLTVTDPLVSSDTGETLVPTRALNRLANAIRSKTGYEGDMTVETMAEVLEQTDMWTTEEYCLNLAPAAAELTITLGAIPAYALFQRRNIAKLNLPYAGRIDTSAFHGSTVAEVVAPKLTYLTTSVFYGDGTLVEADFPELTTIEGVSNFYSCYSLSRINFPKLKYIASANFGSCYSLAEVNLPELVNITALSTQADSMFNNCRVLESIELPKFEGIIRNTWFANCYLLGEIILPRLVAITGNNNFQNCYALQKLYVPECMTWANNNFAGCTSLKRLCLYVKPTTLGATALNGPALEDIYVSWSNGEVAGAPWGAPAGCTVHYDTEFDADGDPIT